MCIPAGSTTRHRYQPVEKNEIVRPLFENETRLIRAGPRSPSPDFFSMYMIRVVFPAISIPRSRMRDCDFQRLSGGWPGGWIHERHHKHVNDRQNDLHHR